VGGFANAADAMHRATPIPVWNDTRYKFRFVFDRIVTSDSVGHRPPGVPLVTSNVGPPHASNESQSSVNSHQNPAATPGIAEPMKAHSALPITLGLWASLACSPRSEEDVASVSEPIISGTFVKQDPVGVAFLSLTRPSDGKVGYCSGIALTNTWILTAKHCTQVAASDPANVYVRAFANEVLLPPTPIPRATNIIEHPTSDVALVRLSTPVTVSSKAPDGRIFRFPSSAVNTFYPGTVDSMLNTKQTCYGYGDDTLGSGYGILRQAVGLPVAEIHPDSHSYWILPNELGQTPYSGDSGGPCVYYDPTAFDPYRPLLAGDFTESFYPAISEGVVDAGPIYRGWVDWWMFTDPVIEQIGAISGFSASRRTSSSYDMFGPLISGVAGRTWSSGSWGDFWFVPGVNTITPPSSVSWSSDRIDLIALDTGGAVKHASCSGSTCGTSGWSGWEDLSGSIGSNFYYGTAAASWGENRLDAFAMNGNQLVHRVFSNGWQDWYSLGCCGIGAPAAVSWGYGRLDVFLRGNDDAIYHRWCSDGICNDVSHWSDWESLGGVVIAPPAVTSFRPGRLDLFAIGTNSDVFHKVYEAGWDDWNDIGGPYNGGIAAVSLPGGYVSVIGLSQQNQIQSQWRPW
jgi:hypothetical protein